MSCIVGLAEGGTVWIGGDSAANTEELTQTYTGPKVFRRGALLFGAVSSFRMRDILHHELTIPRRKPGLSDDAWLVSHLVEEIRLTFDTAGFDLGEEGEDATPGAVLVGYHGRLFTLDWDFHLGEVRDGYNAIGTGEQFALGSLHSTRARAGKHDDDVTPALPPRERVGLALEAAAHFSTTVRRPFRILSVR